MQISKMQNVIFLNDLASNFVEEAFVVLKENIKVDEAINSSKYDTVVLEAENIINSYIKEIHSQKQRRITNDLQKKCKLLKRCNIVLVVACIICAIFF